MNESAALLMQPVGRRRCNRFAVAAAIVAAALGGRALGATVSAWLSEGEPSPASRDNFDIPWPSSASDAAPDLLDWEKLQTIIRRHNKLYEDWKRERENFRNLNTDLTNTANHLQAIQRYADAVQATMSKIQGVIGEYNAEMSDVFYPPETPRWVQSPLKNYAFRKRELARIDRRATRWVNQFNSILSKLDANLERQQETLSHAKDLRTEWVRLTKPFGIWSRQDRPIPIETSTRWILNNPAFTPAYLARCVAEIREKKFESAEKDIKSAIEKDPSWAELYGIQAVLEDRAGKPTETQRTLKAARRRAKKSSFLEVCEGVVHSKHHNYAGARVNFRNAAKYDASDPAGQAQLALLLSTCPDPKLRDAAKAVEAATDACRRSDWSHWWCFDVLATAYAADGQFDRAVGCVRRAKQAGPADVQPLLESRLVSYEKRQLPTVAVGEL